MQKINFDAGWEFRTGNPWCNSDPVIVDLPHDAQILEPRSAEYDTQRAGAYFKNGMYSYTKMFTPPDEWAGKSLMLEVEGVYQWGEVRVNGLKAGYWPYGYSSYIVDITGYLKPGQDNEIKITANNVAVPNSRWYSGAGVYRHVWLRAGGPAYIKPWGVRVKTPVVNTARSVAEVAARVENPTNSEIAAAVVHTVYFGGKPAARAEKSFPLPPGGCEVTTNIGIDGAKLWSVGQPNLYTLKTEIVAGAKVIDSETTAFGIRRIEFDAVNGFRLNGLKLNMKGGCVHHDNGILGSASFDRAEQRKVELMKASGYNAVRCAHNPPSPGFLDACDRLGMLVIDETFDCWRKGKRSGGYQLFFDDWWQRDTWAMVARDFNHPSVIMWSIGNEVLEQGGDPDGALLARRQADYVRCLDDTRPVTAALFPYRGDADSAECDEWADQTYGFASALDVAGYNYLIRRYERDHERFPDRVICATETYAYDAYDYWKAVERLPYVIGDFVWTSLDYLGESGIGRSEYGEGPLGGPYPWNQAFCGDIDVCGFKRPQSYYRDVLWGAREKPYIAVRHPKDFGKPVNMNKWAWPFVCDNWTYPGHEGADVYVEVYSDRDEVELLVNGVSMGRKKTERNIAVFEIKYQPGALTAVAYQNGRESGSHEIRTAGGPYALKLTADRGEIGTGGDLCYVTVEVVDKDGMINKNADHVIGFEISGAGVLQAVGCGNPQSEEPYFGDRHSVYEGRGMAVVRSLNDSGEVTLKATAEGLAGAEVTVRVV